MPLSQLAVVSPPPPPRSAGDLGPLYHVIGEAYYLGIWIMPTSPLLIGRFNREKLTTVKPPAEYLNTIQMSAEFFAFWGSNHPSFTLEEGKKTCRVENTNYWKASSASLHNWSVSGFRGCNCDQRLPLNPGCTPPENILLRSTKVALPPPIPPPQETPGALRPRRGYLEQASR